ncbi:unnamed protein product [Staurois parvus]|uniref:Uncharacterized protein n=1 Tax=Staurois parvus TaxID=386267 RepID=A0ABN9D576_9NEOB|nr:unnamed protein product [Staurois parvus]
MRGPGRADIVNAGSEETTYSECRVQGDRIYECGVRESGYSECGSGESGYSECRIRGEWI